MSDNVLAPAMQTLEAREAEILEEMARAKDLKADLARVRRAIRALALADGDQPAPTRAKRAPSSRADEEAPPSLVIKGDAPRLRRGRLPSKGGVEQLNATDSADLIRIGKSLRERGLKRSPDGWLKPGLYDLVQRGEQFCALYIPSAPEEN